MKRALNSNLKMTSLEVSELALIQAKDNADKFMTPIKFIHADIFAKDTIFKLDHFDIIVSNPPYIDTHQLKYLGVREYEPYTALNGGINGTEVLMKVVVKASQLLKVNGKLIIEIGKDQKYKMIKFFNRCST